MAYSLVAVQLELNPFGGWLVGLPLAVLFLLVVALAYRTTTHRLTPRALATLWALRAASALTLLFVLLRPTLVSVSSRYERPLLVLLQDVSRSMTIRDEPSAPAKPGDKPMPRVEAIAAGLERNRALLADLVRKYDVAVYQFSDRLKDVGGETPDPGVPLDAEAAAREAARIVETPLVADGPSTRLGDCLKEAYESNVKRRILGIILLSDGAANLSQMATADAAHLLARRGIPVYAAGYGSPEPTGAVRDSVARNITARPTVFVGNRIEVVGDYLFHGLRGRKVEVHLLADGKKVGQETIDVTSNRFDCRVKIPWRAEAAGSHRLELAAVPFDGEDVLTNNRIWTFVDAAEGGLKVAVVSGFLRPEARFIAEAVRQAGEFDLDWIFAPGRKEAAQQVPATVEKWAEYNVVVFDDIPRSYLSDEQLASLAKAVAERGTGFLMTAGEHAFGPGGYAGTPIANLLPVRIGAGDGPLGKAVAFRPTAAGIRVGILQLEKDKAESMRAWESLPPLTGAARLGEPKSTAEVLAAAETGDPLLVFGQYQAGRVAALAVSTTWQWQMEGRDDPPGKHFRRFWRQLLLFLTGQEETRGNVWVMTAEQRYSLPELQSRRRAIVATAGVSDGQGNPVTDATCTLELAGPGPQDSRPVVLSRRGETYEAAIDAAHPGDYQLTLKAFRGDRHEQVGVARTRFVVYVPDLELEEPQADFAALEDLCRTCGGRFWPAARLGELLEGLLEREVANLVKFERRRTLWDNFYVLGVFTALLAVEWVLRKRLGLV